jgi:hypothetical protein
MRRRYTLPSMVLIGAALLAACASAAMLPEPMLLERSVGGAEADFGAYSQEAPAAPPAEMPMGETALVATSNERLVVQNGNMSVVVVDPAEAADDIRLMAEGMGGFVVNLNTYQSYFGDQATPATQASITVRVPSERLNEAIEQIKAASVEVRNVTVSGEDVTAQYTDLASRLRSLEAAEEQLTEIMQEARRTEDVMMVYNQLSQVQTEIEIVKGQMRYYEESARLSALSVDLIPDIASQPIETGGWQIIETFKSAVEALVNAVKFFVRAAIWIGIYILPVLLILGLLFVLPIVLIVRGIRRRRRARAKAQQG